MKFTKWRQATLLSVVTLLFVVTGCKNDEPVPPTIQANDLTVTIDENPLSGATLGTLSATTDKGTLSYVLKSESVAGAFSVNSTTGAVSVLDSAKFDYEKNQTLTAIATAVNGNVTSDINIIIHLQKIIWEGAPLTFSKASGADWTLPANQDKITNKVIFTRQNKGPLYNYQWWQTNFQDDAAYEDIYDDFWDDNSSLREFVRQGGTKGVRWAILDSTNSTPTQAWGDFKLYGTLGDTTHFYSFHAIASIIYSLENGTNVIGVPDNFSIETADGVIDNASTDMPSLVGKKLALWLVDEDIYLTLTFTNWGSGGSNTISYTRSTKD